MSTQESVSVLTELEPPPARVGPTGTTHILTVKVSMDVMPQATISDPKLRIHNGDTVIWRFNVLVNDGNPELAIAFTGTDFPMVSTGTQVGSDLRVEVSEDGGLLEVEQPYLLRVGSDPLSFVSSFSSFSDPVSPQLVIDNMGGMMTEV